MLMILIDGALKTSRNQVNTAKTGGGIVTYYIQREVEAIDCLILYGYTLTETWSSQIYRPTEKEMQAK